MAELADALDLGSSAARRGGSSPFIRTTFIWKAMAHILILKATNNKEVTDKLFKSTIDTISSYNYTFDEVHIPSTTELAVALSLFVESKHYEAAICIGLVHNIHKNPMYFAIYQEVLRNLGEFSSYYTFPVGINVMYSDSIDDALEIAESFGENVASATCQMVTTIRNLNSLENDSYGRNKKHN